MKWIEQMTETGNEIQLALVRADGSPIFVFTLRDRREAETFKSGFRNGLMLITGEAQRMMQIR